MPTVPGGVEGEFQGRVYPVVIGLKSGPRPLHMCGKGTTWKVDHRGHGGIWLVVTEPSGNATPNLIEIPLDNVAFIGSPMFLIETPPK